jgi:hypothetical protein
MSFDVNPLARLESVNWRVATLLGMDEVQCVLSPFAVVLLGRKVVETTKISVQIVIARQKAAAASCRAQIRKSVETTPTRNLSSVSCCWNITEVNLYHKC